MARPRGSRGEMAIKAAEFSAIFMAFVEVLRTLLVVYRAEVQDFGVFDQTSLK